MAYVSSAFGPTSLVEDPQKAASTKPKKNRPAPKKATAKRQASGKGALSLAPRWNPRRQPYSTDVLDSLHEWTDDPVRAIKSGVGDAVAVMRRQSDKSNKRAAEAVLKDMMEDEAKERRSAMEAMAKMQSAAPQGPALPEEPPSASFPDWLTQRYPRMAGRVVPKGTTERLMNQWMAEQQASGDTYKQRLARYELGQRAVGGGGYGRGRSSGAGGGKNPFGITSGVDRFKALTGRMTAEAAKTTAGANLKKANAPFVPSSMGEYADVHGLEAAARLFGIQHAKDPGAQEALIASGLGAKLGPSGFLDLAGQARQSQNQPRDLEALQAKMLNSGQPIDRRVLDLISNLRAAPDVLASAAKPPKPDITLDTLMRVAPAYVEQARAELTREAGQRGTPGFGQPFTGEDVARRATSLISGMTNTMRGISQGGGLRPTQLPAAGGPVSQPQIPGQAEAAEAAMNSKHAIYSAFPEIIDGEHSGPFDIKRVGQLMKMDGQTFSLALRALVDSGWIDETQAESFITMYFNENPQAR